MGTELHPELDHDDYGDTPDAGELPPLDLSPRTAPGSGARPHRSKTIGRASVVIAVLVLIAGAFILVRALGGNTLYFYNADEAVAQKTNLAGQRFRLQGTVLGDTVKRTGDGVDFTVQYAGAVVPVHHVGDPPQLFQGGVPVLLEGSWSPDGSAFASDRMLIKHTEEYDEKNSDRLRQADQGGKQAPSP